MTCIIGIDPALTKTGWGIIHKSQDNTLRYIASDIIKTNASDDLPLRLKKIADEISSVIKEFDPDQVAIEETFLNKNPVSSLKLGHARGAIIVSCCDLPIYEYSATAIKKTITGVGRAEKEQVSQMVKILLPQAKFKYDDESDALAVAICHVHHG